VALVATFRSRRRWVLEPGLKAFALGATLLGAAAAGGLVLLLSPGASSAHGAMAYGVTIIAGALTFMILGMLCKIVPFLVWMTAYGPLAGRHPVPSAAALGSRALERAWLGLHGAALAVLLTGIVAAAPAVVAGGAALLAAAVAVYLANFARVLAHAVRPLPVLQPGPAVAVSSP
jgi:hypothetical protein